ncbi:hypothetical protein AVEN_40966-1 [Araneus ventricosus]|uniref:Uncharacterized protein n=1 Tax=Araneus ventricosus TaxID=182803 RepID=A0A4Y2F970_ARAVE|nr:hypothetical protein AVEN_40966-1 [Araneus ventricosus]
MPSWPSYIQGFNTSKIATRCLTPTSRIVKKLSSIKRGFLFVFSGALRTTPAVAFQIILEKLVLTGRQCYQPLFLVVAKSLIPRGWDSNDFNIFCVGFLNYYNGRRCILAAFGRIEVAGFDLARKEQSNLLTVKFFATESVDWGWSSVLSFGYRRTTGYFFFDAAEDFGLGFCFMTTEANVRGASCVVGFLIGVECCSWVGDASIATTLPAVVVWTLAYFVPPRNVIYVRLKLFLLVERGGQSVDDFITDLRKELRNCDYGSLLDSVMVVQLVRRLCDANLRERLLRVADLDITKTVTNFKVHITEEQKSTP